MDPIAASSKSESVASPLWDGSRPSATPETLTYKVEAFVRKYMSQPQFDASHDYSHVLRVLALAEHILSVETMANSCVVYDRTVVTLAALMHDVGDHKYILTTDSPEVPVDPDTLVWSILVQLGSSPIQASQVQTIVKAISYSHEVRDPASVVTVLSQHPELAIVQDADRLDALGAVGIARTFTYGAAKVRKGRGMDESIQHFEDKLLRLEGMMKTGEGKRLARLRTERLNAFKEWWVEENAAKLSADNEIARIT
ncbi:hypothetical protein MMC30_006877 [Trapelia coarctata]|nr:hypothetical protein [Trapelia coarctata]